MSQSIVAKNFPFPSPPVRKEEVFSLDSFGNTLRPPEYVSHAGHFKIPQPATQLVASPTVTIVSMAPNHFNRQFFILDGTSTAVTINPPNNDPDFDNFVFGSTYEIWIENVSAVVKTVTFNISGAVIWLNSLVDADVTPNQMKVFSVLPRNAGVGITNLYANAAVYEL